MKIFSVKAESFIQFYIFVAQIATRTAINSEINIYPNEKTCGIIEGRQGHRSIGLEGLGSKTF
jgi:hypothetical protein